MAPKMRKSKVVSWNIPPNDDIMINEGFKGKIDQTCESCC
jgi:hypothetical protein